MLFEPLDIDGAYKISVEPIADERGFFARAFCKDEFASHGLVSDFPQMSISFNRLKGTVRGMHFQIAPEAETKLVRCTKGRIFDVIVDLRPGSKTFKKWQGVELSEANHAALYVPVGIAHGYQTLSDDAELHYLIDRAYRPGYSSGVRWNDPSVEVRWTEPITLISPRDLAFADLEA